MPALYFVISDQPVVQENKWYAFLSQKPVKLFRMSLKIPYGLKDGILWFVTDVPNGNDCGCICPKCKIPLQARNNPNNVKRAYFAHSRPVECTYSGMTDVHIMAQQILFESKCIQTPEYRDKPKLKLIDGSTIYGDDIVIRPHKVHADVVFSEYSWKEFVPDIAFKVGEKELFIEIAVTHFIDDAKRKAVVKNDIAMIEIDFSSLSDEDFFDKEKFSNKVLCPGVHAKWVHNPRGALLKKQSLANLKKIQNHKNSKLQVADKKKQDERNKLEPYLKLLKESKSSDWKEARIAELANTLKNKTHIQDWQMDLDIYPLVGIKVKGDWIINTHRVNWQTFIIDVLINDFKNTSWKANDIKRMVVKIFGIIDFMNKLNITKQALKSKNRAYYYYDDESCSLEHAERESIISPFLPVINYIKYLESIEFVQKRDESFLTLFSDLDAYATNSIEQKQKYLREKAEQERRAREAEECRKQLNDEHKQDITEKIKERIILLLAADQRLFDEGKGEGNQCNNCQMALLSIDEVCPFCGCNDKSHYEVTLDDIKTLKYRYKSDTKPRISVLAEQSLNLSCLSQYSD